MAHDQQSTIQIVDAPLSISEESRLVVIAHETRDPAIRAAALAVLARAHAPAVIIGEAARAKAP